MMTGVAGECDNLDGRRMLNSYSAETQFNLLWLQLLDCVLIDLGKVLLSCCQCHYMS